MFKVLLEYNESIIEITGLTIEEFVENLKASISVENYKNVILKHCSASYKENYIRKFYLIEEHADDLPCEVFQVVNVNTKTERGFDSFSDVLSEFFLSSNSIDIKILEAPISSNFTAPPY